MRSSLLLVVFALFFVHALSIPTSKTFTADITVTESDDSVGKLTWNYDIMQKAERIVYHREGGLSTIDYRLYSLGVEYLFIEGEEGEDTCYLMPLTDKRMPSVPTRAAIFSNKNKLVSWTNIVNAPVDPALFQIPSACQVTKPQDDPFCSTCVGLGTKVISLGCNATADAIAKVCGEVFETICATILDYACNATCTIEQCPADVCCLFDLCSGSQCNSTTTSDFQPPAAGPVASLAEGVSRLGDDPFCSTCIDVSSQVVTLGCNATSTDISNLCGDVFAGICKQVLETLCSGVCSIEQCATQTCCIFKLCDAASCSNSTTTTGGHQYTKLTY